MIALLSFIIIGIVFIIYYLNLPKKKKKTVKKESILNKIKKEIKEQHETPKQEPFFYTRTAKEYGIILLAKNGYSHKRTNK